MKKTVVSTLAAVAVCAGLMAPMAATTANAATAEDWDLTRASVAYTDKGIEISQLEMGTPDNHAIAIYEIPFENLNEFEITFRIEMMDYVASGRNANDVWTAVNIMGVPAFFNWRNSEQYGWAKDSPGLVTRFMSYDGDLRMVTDVYQGGYKTAGDDPSSQTVDTWTLLNKSAGAALESDVTMKLVYETSGASHFYSMYINGVKISTTDELAFVDQSVVFPENKLYLTVVMNTQNKASNDLSKITIKSINGTSYVKEGSATDDDNNNGGNNNNSTSKKEGGCGSSIGCGGIALSAALCAAGGAMLRKKRK